MRQLDLGNFSSPSFLLRFCSVLWRLFINEKIRVQKKSVLFYAIFRLTYFSFNPFDFSSSKTAQIGSAQWALSALSTFQLKLFWKLILMVWREVLRGWRHPQCWPPPTIAPHRAVAPHPLFPTPPPVPSATRCTSPPPTRVATDEQPIAKNTQFFHNFHNFFQVFWNFFCHFWVSSALGVKEPPLGFDNRLMHNFWW